MESVVEAQTWYEADRLSNMCGALTMEGAGIEGSQIKLEDRYLASITKCYNTVHLAYNLDLKNHRNNLLGK